MPSSGTYTVAQNTFPDVIFERTTRAWIKVSYRILPRSRELDVSLPVHQQKRRNVAAESRDALDCRRMRRRCALPGKHLRSARNSLGAPEAR